MLTHPRIAALAEIGLCSGIPTQRVVGTALRAGGWSPLTQSGGLSLPFVLALSAIDTVLVIGLMVALTRARGQSVSDLWLGGRPVGREVALGALLIPAVFGLVVALLSVVRILAPSLHNVQTNPLEQLAATPGAAVIFAVVAIFAGGVREELQRVFLLQRFEYHLGGAGVGVVVLSTAFGLGHAVQGWDAVIGTGVLGVVWSLLYLRRRSVLAPMVSHSGFNALEVLRVAIMGA
jgi:membrane protease YdiL (CAAX protease family)